MAQRFIHDFTAANGAVWPDFTRVAGAAFNAVVQGNRGAPGLTATERIYQSDYWPGIRDYKVRANMVWDNGVTAGRGMGLVTRLTDDGSTGYIAVIYSYRPSDNTLNFPHVRVFRRRGSVNTQIVAETPLTGVTGTDLEAGVDVQFRIQTMDDGTVNLQVDVDDGGGWVNFVDYDDAGGLGIAIENDGTVGVFLDGLSDNTDVTIDALECLDFEDEAVDPVSYTEGWSIKVNGVPLSEDELAARGVSALSVRSSYVSGASEAVAEITDICEAHAPAFQNGDDIVVLYNGTVMASGVIRSVVEQGQPVEGHTYTVHGAKQLARGVAVFDPDTLLPTVYFNEDTESEFYDLAKSDMTPGDILEWLFDNCTEGEDGLRAHKAAGSSGVIFDIPAGMYSGPILAGVQVGGDFASAVEHVLSHMPAYAWRVDPETGIHYFEDRSVASTYDFDKAGPHTLHQFDVQPQQAKTVVFIVGGEPEVVWETMSLGDGSLIEGWNTGLGEEANYNAQKRRKYRDTGTVAAVGVVGAGPWAGYQYIQSTGIDDLTDGEWEQTVLTFTSGVQAGNSYTINENTAATGEFVLASAWVGAAPSPGDTFEVASAFHMGLRDNLWNEMWAVYQVQDAAKRDLAAGRCVDVRFKYPLPTGGQGQTSMSGTVGTDGRIKLDQPALLPAGLDAYPAGQNAGVGCADTGGPDGIIGDIEADVPVRQGEVPRIRVPAAGFRGTAYALDSGRWDGGGEATVGDAGVKAALVLEDANFQYPGTQTTEYTKLADELLKVLGTLPVRADIRQEGVVNLDLLGLNKRITLSDTVDDNRLTGYEAATDMWLMEVRYTWTPDGTSTQALCGTQSSFGGLNIDSVRRTYSDTIINRAQREQMKLLAEMYKCLKETLGGQGGKLGGLTNSPICSEEVAYNNTSRSEKTTVKDKLDILQEVLIPPIWDFLTWQKGGTVWFGNDGGTFKLKFTDPDGTVFTYIPSTGKWRPPGGAVDGSDDIDNPASESGTNEPTDPPKGGLEGYMWDLLMMLGNFLFAQKGMNFVHGLAPAAGGGNVGVPGVTGKNGKTYWYDPETDTWYEDDGDGIPETGGGPGSDPSIPSTTPLDPDGTGKPENLGGLEGDVLTELESIKAKILGMVPNGKDSGGKNTVILPNGNIYAPFLDLGAGDVGFELSVDSPGGLPGPHAAGLLGNLAGKCGTTEDGAALVGSGPGTLLAPGDTVGADGAYYYMPTQQAGREPEFAELAPGDTVPASTLDQQMAVALEQSLLPYDLNDPGGVVYYDESHKSGSHTRYWRVQAGSQRFIEVESTPGVGLNSGDWSDVSPTRYHEGPGRGGTMKRAVTVATAAALPACTLSEPTLTATGFGALTVDGRAMAVGERVLVKDQASANQNGIFTVIDAGSIGTPWVLRRSLDTARYDSTLSGGMVFVREGSTLPNTLWYMSTTGPVEPGTTNQSWTQFSAGGGGGTGRLLAVTVYNTAGSGNHTWNGSATQARVLLIGGGGGGGGAPACPAGTSAVTGGGASGGTTEHFYTTLPGSPVAYTVGALGAGGAPGVPGAAGTQSSFGGLTAGAGGGGATMVAAAGAALVLGGTPVAGGGGNVAVAGGNPGAPGMKFGIAPGVNLGGNGGCSHYGGGGQAPLAAGGGVAATGPGAGGSGCAEIAGGGGLAGGNGADGLIVVWEYA